MKIIPVKILSKAVRTGTATVVGLILGSLTGWIYYGFLLVVNIRKKRISLSTGLRSFLKRYYPSIIAGNVRIIGNAVGVPPGKIAVTHGNNIFCKESFCEEKTDDMNLLYHELVHIDQYKKHREWFFYFLYGYQYLNEGFSYSDMPLEKEAFDYTRRFKESAG